MIKKLFIGTFAFCSLAAISGCKDGGVNIFTIEDDKTFGAQVEAEIAANPTEYPLLPRTGNEAAYAYLEAMRDEILASGKLNHRTDFVWKLYIINDDNTQNAFCTPGGYIYVYTGLIKYLDNASSLAGVLGHEMAHADRRHSTDQMTEQYGLSTLLQIVVGENQNALADIAANLTSLAFSRGHEKEADEYSVEYLCPTQYRADGAADFFIKINNSGAQQPPAFLSTHPNPENRVTNIQTKENDLGCNNTPTNQVEIANYNSFKALF
jgi:predicted Zn-dependent protease